jgi:hypothetical protein
MGGQIFGQKIKLGYAPNFIRQKAPNMKKALRSLLPISIALLTHHASNAGEGDRVNRAVQGATQSAQQVVRLHISNLQSGLGMRFGLTRSQDGRNDRAASWDDGIVTYSATPTFVNFNNDIKPLTSKGTVGVVVLGVEHFDEIDTLTGLTLTIDAPNLTSREYITSTSTLDTKVNGSGLTFAPYFAKQTDDGGMVDVSAGFGFSNLSTNTAGVTSRPKSNRMFFSVGYTKNSEFSDSAVLTAKNIVSYSSDTVGAFTMSDNTAIEKSTSSLMQAKVQLGLSWPSKGWTPYTEGGLTINSLSVSSNSGTTPKEHSLTPHARAGLRTMSEDGYADFSVQMEKDKSRVQVYAGFRF